MSASVTLYGIANCDSIKKARNWLGGHNIDYRFHDYRKQGIDTALLQLMTAQLGWEAMLNRRGTTWRALAETQKSQIDETSALRLMNDNPAIIKRPILALDDKWHIAFSDRQYQEIFTPA